MKTVVVTGANRGLGLGLAKRFSEKGYQVIGTARRLEEATELKSICRVESCDVTSDDSVSRLADRLHNETIDILINNAGVYLDGNASFAEISFATALENISVNAVSPMRVTRALLPMLQKSEMPIIANMSSKMGSIADNESGGYYGYRMSKAALNMFNKSFSIDYPNIISVVLHPGWVKTDMGSQAAPLTVEESTHGMLRVIESLKSEQSGSFIDYKGRSEPW